MNKTITGFIFLGIGILLGANASNLVFLDALIEEQTSWTQAIQKLSLSSMAYGLGLATSNVDFKKVDRNGATGK